MRRAPGVDPVAPRIGAGFDSAEIVIAVFIREGTSATAKIRVYRGQIGVFLVPIATAGIGLPDLNQRVRNGARVFVQNPAMQDDALANRAGSGLGVVLQQVVVDRVDVIMAEHRPGDFADRILQADQ